MDIAAITALAGFIGLIVGRYWDSRFEAKRWRRDERVKTYQGLAEEFYQLREAIREVGLLEPNTPDSSEAELRVKRVAVSWNGKRAAVWLHGTHETAKAARTLDDAMNDLFVRLRQIQITAEGWQEERKPAQVALDIFVQAVRRDLGLAPLDVDGHWHPRHHSEEEQPQGIEDP